MVSSSQVSRSKCAWDLAADQQGLIARRQLLELGFSARSIQHKLSRKRLIRIRRGVYSVGWAPLTQDRRWMAALLACGPDAALSHRSAAGVWKIAPGRESTIDVSIPRKSDLRQVGIRVRARPGLNSKDLTGVGCLRVTTPARTLLDFADEAAVDELERAVNEADKRGLIDPEELRRFVVRRARVRGVARLRKLLDRDTFRLSDSSLERRFRKLAERAGLPAPHTKQRLNGFEVDFYWPDLGLVVETDGLRYHRTPAAQARDLRRDQAHAAAGIATLRFSDSQVRFQSSHVIEVLSRMASNLRSRAAET